MAATSMHDDVLLDPESRARDLMPDVDSLVGSLESTRSGKVATEVPRGLGRHGYSKRRSSANGVGKFDGDGKI